MPCFHRHFHNWFLSFASRDDTLHSTIEKIEATFCFPITLATMLAVASFSVMILIHFPFKVLDYVHVFYEKLPQIPCLEWSRQDLNILVTCPILRNQLAAELIVLEPPGPYTPHGSHLSLCSCAFPPCLFPLHRLRVKEHEAGSPSFT